MSREDDLLIVDYVHEDEAKGQRFTDLAPVRLTFNLSEDVPDLPPDIHFGTGGVELTRGRLRDSLRLITTDPEEDRASRHLHQRLRSEEHTSELQSLMRISYAVFCLNKQTNYTDIQP